MALDTGSQLSTVTLFFDPVVGYGVIEGEVKETNYAVSKTLEVDPYDLTKLLWVNSGSQLVRNEAIRRVAKCLAIS